MQAANAAKQKRGSFYRAKYNKLKFQLGSANKAKVAIANRMARSIYKILCGDRYKEIGYARASDNEKRIEQLVKQLRSLGVSIRHERHEKIVSAKKIRVDSTGVHLD